MPHYLNGNTINMLLSACVRVCEMMKSQEYTTNLSNVSSLSTAPFPGLMGRVEYTECVPVVLFPRHSRPPVVLCCVCVCVCVCVLNVCVIN
jgi:hypothetical protein